MANVFVEESTLTAIADAIRTKTGSTDKMLPAAMPEQIAAITGGGSGESADERVKYVTFMNGTAELLKYPVIAGDTCRDPIEQGLIETPPKESTEYFTYEYAGWALTDGGEADEAALQNVTEDKTVYVAFAASTRYYTVNFYDGETLVDTVQVQYGETATTDYEKANHDLVAWTPAPENITQDTDCYGEWVEAPHFGNMAWAEIAAISESGEASTRFSLGDTREINGMTFEIIAFDHDTMSDGTKVGMTLACKVPAGTRRIGDYSSANNGGYGGSTIINAQDENAPNGIFNNFSEDLQAVIKKVKKAYDVPKSSSISIESRYLAVWLFSNTEVFLEPSYGLTGQGDFYEWFEDSANRIRYNANGEAVGWWLRSTASTTAADIFWTYVNADGELARYSPDNYKYIAVGFCI